MASEAETVSNVMGEQGNVAPGERAALKYSSPEAPPGVPKPDKQSPYGRQLLMGQEVEKEHKGTINWLKKNPDAPLEAATRSIASEHIPEDKKYYTHLKEMEEKYKTAMWTGLFDELEKIGMGKELYEAMKGLPLLQRPSRLLQQHLATQAKSSAGNVARRFTTSSHLPDILSSVGK